MRRSARVLPAVLPAAALATAALLGGCRPPASAMKAHEGAPGLRGELSQGGTMAARLAPADGADLVLFYGTDEGGSLAPCGCTETPRGGLARQASYIAASTAAQPGVAPLLLHAGGWSLGAVGASGDPRGDAALVNQWMVEGMAALGVDAANAGWDELAGLRSLDGAPAFPVISANLAGPGIVGEHLLEAGGHRVLVTGISTPGPAMVDTPGYTRREPLDALRAQLDGARERSDLIVLLSHASPTEARIAAEEGLVDVVIDANQHRFSDVPLRVGPAVWVRAWHQTQRLGELRIGLAPAGAPGPRVAWATDRKIEMDPAVPEAAPLRTMARQAQREIERTQLALFGQVL